MLQAGYELCLGLEAADEVGFVGVFWQDDLDRHLAIQRGLMRPINRAKATNRDLFAQFVAFDDLTAKIFHKSLP